MPKKDPPVETPEVEQPKAPAEETLLPFNVVIDGNWLSGGKCTINMTPKPLGSLNAITVTNNVFTDNSSLSCPILDTTQTNLTASGNVYAGTGLPVAVNNKGSNS